MHSWEIHRTICLIVLSFHEVGTELGLDTEELFAEMARRLGRNAAIQTAMKFGIR